MKREKEVEIIVKETLYQFIGIFIKAKGNPYHMAEIENIYGPLIEQMARNTAERIEGEFS